MSRIVLTLFLATATAFGSAAELAPLDSPEIQAEWRPLFTTMADKGGVRSAFTEHRWLVIRPEPIELEGEMRMSPGHGLSLHYTSPESQTVIVDDKGIVMRDAKGRSRTVKSGSRATAVIQTLLPVMRFDFDRLLKEFSIAAGREGDNWTIQLTSNNSALLKSLGVLRITGAGEAIERLEFDRSEKQRIEIIVDATETDVTFSSEEMERFFR